MADYTPMMKQYSEIKRQYEDCILFFRLGDFYEMFADDAKLAAEELDLTLTTRDRSKENPEERTPMCGVPYHSSEAYIARLIAKGYKVAICEQTEDPALAKGLVSREVTRVVTPGTVMDTSMLEEKRNNYLCSIHQGKGAWAVCFADISTGEVYAASYEGAGAKEHLFNELGRFSPSEAVLSQTAWEDQPLRAFLLEKLGCRCENGGEARYAWEQAQQQVQKQFGSEGASVLPGEARSVVCAVGGLLSYLQETQKTDLSHLSKLQYYTNGQYMELDYFTRRNLELTETFRVKEKRGSLLWVLDKTKTAMGGRLLRAYLERPLLDPSVIEERQSAVEELTQNTIWREELSLQLSGISDLERLIGKVIYGTANGRDLVALSAGFAKIPALLQSLQSAQSPGLKRVREELDPLDDVGALIDRAIVDEPPFSVREGGFIRPGYDSDVDRLHKILTGGKDLLTGIETREREKTGIKNLKVGYNKVFGYYIEVSKSNYELVPDTYVRRQTLANCERYITQELKDLEHEILSAKDKIVALEYRLFTALREQVAKQVDRIQKTAAVIARLDVLLSFAVVAVRYNYTRPKVDRSDVIEIADGRHPVVEQMLRGSLFVPNDTKLDCEDNCLAIITGPNMAGKSTYMRQVALIVLLAQAGSFVPAKKAHIGIVDRIFTRIGASDDLAAGQSTFMVEMTEVAEILKNATPKSLLILDEIGRGTSTFDGMSIARAVLECCADKNCLGAKTLFATHYHELTVLEGILPGVKNYNIAAKKRKDDVIFLRKIVRGGADQSYGIEVARLAGVPEPVIRRAKEILEMHEGEGLPSAIPVTVPANQAAEEKPEVQAIMARLQAVDLNTLTPIESMNLLYEFKQKLDAAQTVE